MNCAVDRHSAGRFRLVLAEPPEPESIAPQQRAWVLALAVTSLRHLMPNNLLLSNVTKVF